MLDSIIPVNMYCVYNNNDIGIYIHQFDSDRRTWSFSQLVYTRKKSFSLISFTSYRLQMPTFLSLL